MSPQILDAGPRGAANLENMAALSQGSKKTLSFFKGDDGGTPIGTHKVFDFGGEQQSVGMVQTWNQCNDMLLTSMDKRQSVLLMDTETGATKSELSLRRQNKNWRLDIESITPQQKFQQYRQTNEYHLFGLGDRGTTVFAMRHDARAGENVEEMVIQVCAPPRSWRPHAPRSPCRGRRHALVHVRVKSRSVPIQLAHALELNRPCS